jgi:hypothetical protein
VDLPAEPLAPASDSLKFIVASTFRKTACLVNSMPRLIYFFSCVSSIFSQIRFNYLYNIELIGMAFKLRGIDLLPINMSSILLGMPGVGIVSYLSLFPTVGVPGRRLWIMLFIATTFGHLYCLFLYAALR